MLRKLLIALAVSATASAGTLTFKPERTIRITTQIGGSSIAIANKIANLSESPGDIDMLINSPGGNVFVMNIITAAMEMAQERGVKFNCVSTVGAASAAFTIFAHCDNRYAMAGTRLLFHPASVSGVSERLTEFKALELYKELNKIDLALARYLLPVMGMDEAQFVIAFVTEKWWDGPELDAATKDDFMSIVTRVDGLKNPFDIGGVD
jgi:ATP-dependent protease ClpP protease subunit